MFIVFNGGIDFVYVCFGSLFFQLVSGIHMYVDVVGILSELL